MEMGFRGGFDLIKAGFSIWWRRQGISYLAAQMALLFEKRGIPTTIRPFEKYEKGVHWREDTWLYDKGTYSSWLDIQKPSVVFFIHHCPPEMVQENAKKGVKSVYLVMWERAIDYERSMKNCDWLVATSDSCKKFLDETHHASKTLLIPWMMDYHSTPVRPVSDTVKLYCPQGLPEPRRRFDFAYRAIGELLKEGRKLQTTISFVGHLLPRDRQELVHMGGKFALESKVDWVSHTYYMKMADLVLWPTTREGLGLVGMESILQGTPVVAYDVPPVNEYLAHGVNSSLARCSIRWFRRGVPEVNVDDRGYEHYLGALRYAIDHLPELKNRVYQGLDHRRARFDEGCNHLLKRLGM